jgi:transposase
MDLRKRIVAAYEEMGNKSAVARRFGVSRWTVASYVKRAQEDQLAPTPHPGRPPLLDATGCDQLRKQVREHPEWTLEQHAEGLQAAVGIRLGKSAVSNYLRKLGISYKKKLYRP